MKIGQVALLVIAVILSHPLPSGGRDDRPRRGPTLPEIDNRCTLILDNRDPDPAVGVRLAQRRLYELLSNLLDDSKHVFETLQPTCRSLLVPTGKLEDLVRAMEHDHGGEEFDQSREKTYLHITPYNYSDRQDKNNDQSLAEAYQHVTPYNYDYEQGKNNGETLAEAYPHTSPYNYIEHNRDNNFLSSVKNHDDNAEVNTDRRPNQGLHDEDAIEPFFPWPPPQPFLSDVRPRREFPAQVQDLGAISDLLGAELNRAGYSDLRFFSVHSDGFAMVTRMERIDNNQRPVPGESRWDDSNGLSLLSFSIRDYLLALFTRRAGDFQVFVVIVSPENMVPDPDKQSRPEMVREWQRRGSIGLPASLRRLPFSADYKVYILVYEFRKEEGEAPRAVLEGTATEHLNAAALHFVRNTP